MPWPVKKKRPMHINGVCPDVHVWNTSLDVSCCTALNVLFDMLWQCCDRSQQDVLQWVSMPLSYCKQKEKQGHWWHMEQFQNPIISVIFLLQAWVYLFHLCAAGCHRITMSWQVESHWVCLGRRGVGRGGEIGREGWGAAHGIVTPVWAGKSAGKNGSCEPWRRVRREMSGARYGAHPCHGSSAYSVIRLWGSRWQAAR